MTEYIECKGYAARALETLEVTCGVSGTTVGVSLDSRGYTMALFDPRSGAIKGYPYTISRLLHPSYTAEERTYNLRPRVGTLGHHMMSELDLTANALDPLYDAITDVIVSDSFFRFG